MSWSPRIGVSLQSINGIPRYYCPSAGIVRIEREAGEVYPMLRYSRTGGWSGWMLHAHTTGNS
jgi:hypothetical protein